MTRTRTTENTRRTFLKCGAAAGVAVPLLVRNLFSAPPSRRVRHASFGAAGMAGGDLLAIAAHPNVQIVCVAEVDTGRLDMMKKHLADADKVKVYQDWRELLDREHKNLDSVNVGTPDHMHAPIAMSAMQLGLHTYVQKPLAHDIFEVRRLTEMARQKRLVTQMGIQCHSSAYYRIGVELIQGGAIGRIREVHSWSCKKWGDAAARPTRSDPVPATLDWNLWLGVCAPRPFLAGYYHPSEWRKRLDFGTGTFGDMGCHIFDPVFEALALTAPLSIRSEGVPPNRWNWSTDAVIHYVFPGTPWTEGSTVPVHWYDGDKRPSMDVQALLADRPMPDQGSIFIGAKGVMLLPHFDRPVLLPKKTFADYPLPRNPGSSHYKQFVNAILGLGKTSAALDYSGPLTESVLLGSVATHFPRTTLQWDASRLEFKGLPEATRRLRRTYRQGWDVQGLS